MSTPEDKVADIHQQAKSADQATDDTLHIFVSHKVVDQRIAEIIKKRLVIYGGPRMEIFLSEEIPFGEKWNDALHAALMRADWLIFIYTVPSREWDWCLYETGFFVGKTQTGISKRLVCLYAAETEIPAPLQGWQAVAADEDNIKELLKQIYSQEPRKGVAPVRPDANGENASEWLTESARIIAKSLQPAPQGHTYSKYLTLSLNETQINQFIENGKIAIPGDATIDGVFHGNALDLFDLNRGEFKWSEFYDNLKEQHQDSWVGDLCSQLSKILDRKEITQQSLPTFISARDHSFYFPVIHRLEQVAGSELTLWLLFLPTSTPPSKLVTHTHPYIRLSYGGDRAQIVAASPEAEKLYGRSPLQGTSLEEIVNILTSGMPDDQKVAFVKEQTQLIGLLVGGYQSLNAEICVVFAGEPDKAYLPMITKYFKRHDERYIDVIYLDVSHIAQEDENGVKFCKLL